MEWFDAKEKLPDHEAPVVATELYRYKRYKPASQQAKKGIKGRWQRFNGYGWDNAEAPVEWAEARKNEDVG